MKTTFDPRSKLLVLVLINVIAFTSRDIGTEWLCIGAVAVLLALTGCWRQLFRGLLAYAVCLAAMYLSGLTDNFLTALIGMLVVFFRKMMPIVFFASGFMATTKVGDLISALQSLRVPKVIVIPLTVTLRFFPTLKEEFAYIRDAARLRGLRFNMERILIPMMLRCANIAEELSAASVTRGIERAGKRTSMRVLRLKLRDFALISVFLALTIFAVLGGIPLFNA